ncbi:MAG: NAD-dependent epimerase/dehydratase family protein, partial [Bradyrhizobium canariense]
EPIKLFNHGNMWRDFTYVDDIVEGVIRTLDRPATPNPAWNAEQPENSSSNAPYRVYNIGNNRSVNLVELVETLEKIIGKPAIRTLLPMQAGDVLETRADISPLQRDVGFTPSTPLADGLGRFVEWYRNYHRV